MWDLPIFLALFLDCKSIALSPPASWQPWPLIGACPLGSLLWYEEEKLWMSVYPVPVSWRKWDLRLVLYAVKMISHSRVVVRTVRDDVLSQLVKKQDSLWKKTKESPTLCFLSLDPCTGGLLELRLQDGYVGEGSTWGDGDPRWNAAFQTQRF